MSVENAAVTPVEDAVAAAHAERRARSRMPLRVVLLGLFVLGAFWLLDLYTDPTWSKMQSFLIGWFVGSFVMDWIHQRSGRAPELRPGGRRTSHRAAGRADGGSRPDQ